MEKPKSIRITTVDPNDPPYGEITYEVPLRCPVCGSELELIVEQHVIRWLDVDKVVEVFEEREADYFDLEDDIDGRITGENTWDHLDAYWECEEGHRRSVFLDERGRVITPFSALLKWHEELGQKLKVVEEDEDDA